MAQVQKTLFGKTSLGEYLNAGEDVHLKVAANVLKIPYEEALQRYRAGDEEVAKARKNAKPVNFGGMGGMGAKTFRLTRLKEGEVWEIREIKEVQKAWKEAQPELNDFFALAAHEIKNGPCMIKTIGWGRLRTVHTYSQNCNTKFQGPTSDGAKNAVCEVVRQCYVDTESPLYGCRLVNFVHDELILEIPDDPKMYETRMQRLCQVMIDEYNRITPDYPVKVDPVFMRRWSKKAELIRDGKGNIVPWDC